jgi:hypothetical protein
MALLTAQTKTSLSSTSFAQCDVAVLPPAGQFTATCIDIRDYMDVERKIYGSEETELTNVTRFLFEFSDANGTHYIETREMKISSDDRSNLMRFLTNWLGHAPSLDGDWDYLIEQKGQSALLTVSHQPSKMGDRVWANILTIMAVPEGMAQASIDEDPFPGF